MEITCTDPDDINHYVLIIGYGADHWIIRNSMGSWGISGDALISFENGKDGCIADNVYSAIIA